MLRKMRNKLKHVKDCTMQKFDAWRDRRRGKYPLVSNINFDCTKCQKRILISILDYERACKDAAGKVFHSNVQELFQIIYQLIRLDYVIDVCANDAEEVYQILHKTKYDIVLGFGKIFREVVREQKDALKILYMTENPYVKSYESETERIEYFYRRHKKRAELSRTGKYYKNKDESIADIIISLGNKEFLKCYNKEVFTLYPSALINKQWNINQSNRKKNNFLIYGAGGIIHKGIDILVEVFSKKKECTLYICGNHVSEDLKNLGYAEYPNIIDCGFVDYQSSRFKELVEMCYFTLLLSCSEGTSTGIMTCMCHAMIPVVTYECNLNGLDEYCFYFEDYHLDAVNETINKLLREDETMLQRKSLKIQEFARNNFSIDVYSANMYKILDEITRGIV